MIVQDEWADVAPTRELKQEELDLLEGKKPMAENAVRDETLGPTPEVDYGEL